MGTKQVVVEPHPAYMGCAIGLEKENLPEKLLEYERSGKWIAEEKLDGQWGELRIREGKIYQIISRGGIEKDFPPLLNHQFRKDLNGTLIGEISYGSSCPKMIGKIAVIYDFVNLSFDGCPNADATKMENRRRWEILQAIGGWTDKVCLVERRDSGFMEMYQGILNEKGEGLILKKTSGMETFYVPESRSEYQIKVKKETDVDYVVMGLGWREGSTMSDLTKSKGQENWIKEIIVGQYQNGKLVKECKCGSMEESARKWFSENPEEAIGKVVTVRGYGQFEKTGATRNPYLLVNPDGSFIREDLKPTDCVLGKIRYI